MPFYIEPRVSRLLTKSKDTRLKIRNIRMADSDWEKLKQYLGQNFTKRTADEYKSALKNYIIPFFKDCKLRKIDRALVEKFRSHLIAYTRENGQQLSANTINNIVSIVSVMLQEAARLEYIHRNPARGIGKLSTRDTKKRDILTRKEADRLFEKSKINTIWPERKHYVLKSPNLFLNFP